jgi:Mg2+ and Co2+ transporter CorA
MRALGHLLLWIGFLAGAFCSVYQLEVVDQKWATIPWAWYTLSLCIGVVGVALLRHAKREDHADDAKTDAEYSVIQRSLDRVSETVQRISSQSEHVPAEVLRAIDDECVEPLDDFAESRQALVKRFGLTVYADVMTEFASAERYINRSWSAAADGYVDEIAISLNRANQHLHKAKDLLRIAEGNE